MAVVLEHDWFPKPLPDSVNLGARTWLYSSFAFLHYASSRGVTIGDDTGVYERTFFDLGTDGEVRIGNNCIVAGAVFATNGLVDVGDRVLFSQEVHIIDDEAPAPVRRRRRPSHRSAPIKIGNDVWLGARTTVCAGVTIGEGAIVGAATVVRSDVPEFAVVAGNPARIVGSVRPGFDRQ